MDSVLESGKSELHPAGYRVVGISDGVHYPLDKDQHAGRAGAGLCADGEGEGRSEVVVERIFTIGGLGAKFVDCIINRDYPMIMGTTIFLATLMITMNLITDIVYKIVDPRIKLD